MLSPTQWPVRSLTPEETKYPKPLNPKVDRDSMTGKRPGYGSVDAPKRTGRPNRFLEGCEKEPLLAMTQQATNRPLFFRDVKTSSQYQKVHQTTTELLEALNNLTEDISVNDVLSSDEYRALLAALPKALAIDLHEPHTKADLFVYKLIQDCLGQLEHLLPGITDDLTKALADIPTAQTIRISAMQTNEENVESLSTLGNSGPDLERGRADTTGDLGHGLFFGKLLEILKTNAEILKANEDAPEDNRLQTLSRLDEVKQTTKRYVRACFDERLTLPLTPEKFGDLIGETLAKNEQLTETVANLATTRFFEIVRKAITLTDSKAGIDDPKARAYLTHLQGAEDALKRIVTTWIKHFEDNFQKNPQSIEDSEARVDYTRQLNALEEALNTATKEKEVADHNRSLKIRLAKQALCVGIVPPTFFTWVTFVVSSVYNEEEMRANGASEELIARTQSTKVILIWLTLSVALIVATAGGYLSHREYQAKKK